MLNDKEKREERERRVLKESAIKARETLKNARNCP